MIGRRKYGREWTSQSFHLSLHPISSLKSGDDAQRASSSQDSKLSRTDQDGRVRETWFQPEDFLVTTAKCFNWTIARGIMVWWKHQVIENMRCFSYYFLRLTSGLSSNIFVLKHLKTSFTVPHAFPACSPGFQPPRSVKTLAKMQNVLDCCAWSDCGESTLKNMWSKFSVWHHVSYHIHIIML